MPQRPDEPGEPLVFSGTVKTPDGQPIAGALLDVWHADATVPGTYSNIHPGHPISTSAASCTPTSKDGSSSGQSVPRRTRSPTKARPGGC